MAKRATSSYWLWLGENRASIIKTHGLEGKKAPEVSKKAGELWKTLGPADKKKYEDLAAKDKLRYEEEVKTLGKRERKTRKDAADKRGGKRARGQKDRDAPKRPMSGYFIWTQESREAIMKKYRIEKAGPEFTKKAAEEWKTVSDATKQLYEGKAKAAKEQYKKDLEAYNKRKAEQGENAEEDEDEDEEDDEGEEEA